MTDHTRAITELARQCVASVAAAYAQESTRYFRDLVNCRSAPLLLPLFPNAKEVTESFAAFWAVRTHLRDLQLKDPGITVVCVGDGCTPRTGATFALRSAWTVVSIDPELGPKAVSMIRDIQRLTIDPRPVEMSSTTGTTVLVVAVHSHANLLAAVRTVHANRVAVVAIPCCVAQELPASPDVEYEDFACLSPRRTVKIWRDVRSDVTDVRDAREEKQRIERYRDLDDLAWLSGTGRFAQ